MQPGERDLAGKTDAAKFPSISENKRENLHPYAEILSYLITLVANSDGSMTS
jgi:hypothetical protein